MDCFLLRHRCHGARRMRASGTARGANSADIYDDAVKQLESFGKPVNGDGNLTFGVAEPTYEYTYAGRGEITYWTVTWEGTVF